MNTKTDSWLISSFKNGDENALAVLIERHQKDLFSFIFYKLMDEDLANDIFQDTFIKIIVTLKAVSYTHLDVYKRQVEKVHMEVEHFQGKILQK